MLKFASVFAASVGLMLMSGVFAADDHGHGHAHPVVKHAVSVLAPTQGNEVHGVLRFTATEEGAVLKGEVTGLTPGLHGFHIHEFGDLSDPKGLAAGGHYNPDGHEHGGLHDDVRHVGDLGNIEANADGVAVVDMKISGLKLADVLGRSLVVHAGEDDLKSQPSGNSGDRVAVGVIALSAAPKIAAK
ncbi:superoxide dismutase family protein [Planctomicrobium sp. SH668]|uniref:superoxide dismutase family protein n=1 Tax=Planctomicrobium sp. SH668 TaxID=3448126 RepID=UPI003F5B70DC